MPHDWKYSGYAYWYECINCGTQARGPVDAGMKVTMNLRDVNTIQKGGLRVSITEKYSCEEIIALVVNGS